MNLPRRLAFCFSFDTYYEERRSCEQRPTAYGSALSGLDAYLFGHVRQHLLLQYTLLRFDIRELHEWQETCHVSVLAYITSFWLL